jgi:hypothetical protein
VNILRPGDEPMHYQDGSHRWIPPTRDMDQQTWEAAVRAHLLQHREAFGGAPSAQTDRGGAPSPPRRARPNRIPRGRNGTPPGDTPGDPQTRRS